MQTADKRDLLHTYEFSAGVRIEQQTGTWMSAEQEYFQIGDRVRLSALGKERMTRNRSHTAKVVGYGRTDTRVRVVFDGSTYPVSIHVSYLERDR